MIDLQLTAKRIASARADAGFTQQELAERAGVTPDYMLGVSGGEAPPQARTYYDGTSDTVFAQMRDDPILLLMGQTLAAGLSAAYYKEVIERIQGFRRDVLRETGVLLPSVRWMDDADVPPCAVRLVLRGKTAFESAPESDAQSATEQALAGAFAALRENLALFVNRHMTKLLVERLRQALPFCVEGVIPERVSLTKLTREIKATVERGDSAADLLSIIERLDGED